MFGQLDGSSNRAQFLLHKRDRDINSGQTSLRCRNLEEIIIRPFKMLPAKTKMSPVKPQTIIRKEVLFSDMHVYCRLPAVSIH